MSASATDDQFQRVIIIAPSWIGDAVMSHSLIKKISVDEGTNSIDVFANNTVATIYNPMPEVDEVLINPFDHGELKIIERYRISGKLRERGYTTAYILPNSYKSALIPFMAGIPNRVGYTGEGRIRIINKRHKKIKNKNPLLVDQYLKLADGNNVTPSTKRENPKLTISRTEYKSTLDKYRIASDTRYVCLCPGAEYGSAKKWPSVHFARLSEYLQDDGLTPIMLGGPNDVTTGRHVKNASNCELIDLTGMTSLKEAIHILSRAICVVTNDSGLMHISAALDKPTIALFGSSSPRFTPPLSDRAVIISLALDCSPCFERICPLGHTNCLTNITPKEVHKKISAIQLSH